MSNVDFMTEINQRANLAFSNQMEMLTFFLTDKQQYGINVFKIIEVIETPGRKQITKMPYCHPALIGAINHRGHAVPTLDLAKSLHMDPVKWETELSYIIVCEFSGSTQGLLVTNPNRLINKSWTDIHSPGSGLSVAEYLTALTYDEDGNPVQILDVEKILSEVIGMDSDVPEVLIQQAEEKGANGLYDHFRVLAVDDSVAARSLLKNTLDQIHAPYVIAENAEKAWQILEDAMDDPKQHPFGLIISDIEMPGMDGFSFTMKVKGDPRLKPIHMVLHSSMSNEANRRKAEQVGADGFIAKYFPDKVVKLVLEQLEIARRKCPFEPCGHE
jgi:two-component system chemotaxis response regulator CheV